MELYKLSSHDSLRSIDGFLDKGWYTDQDGAEYLVKGGTLLPDGLSGYEPYSEYIAYIVADTLGIPCAPVKLLDSDLFPDIDCRLPHVSLSRRIKDPKGSQRLHAATILRTMYGREYRRDCINYYKKLPIDLDMTYRMLVFDAIIGNDDRHLNNWDFVLFENEIYHSPLFDNGSSLLSMFSDTELLANLDYDNSKPFRPTHKEQIALVKDWGVFSYDFKLVWFSIRSRIDWVLRLLTQERRYAVQRYLYTRLEYYSSTGGFYANNE